MKLVRITAKHFVVGVVIVNNRVVKAPPIVGYMHGWSLSEVMNYSSRKGWSAIEVSEPSE